MHNEYDLAAEQGMLIDVAEGHLLWRGHLKEEPLLESPEHKTIWRNHFYALQQILCHWPDTDGRRANRGLQPGGQVRE